MRLDTCGGCGRDIEEGQICQKCFNMTVGFLIGIFGIILVAMNL
jgi:hypothetical protein